MIYLNALRSKALEPQARNLRTDYDWENGKIGQRFCLPQVRIQSGHNSNEMKKLKKRGSERTAKEEKKAWGDGKAVGRNLIFHI